MQEMNQQPNANIENLQQYIQTREEEVFKSLTQLALLQLGLQRCRRLKSALMSQEQHLREHLDALNSQTTDPHIVRARQTAVRNLLAIRPRAPSPDIREPGRGQKALETSNPIQAISASSQIANAEPLCQTPPSKPQGDVPAGFYASPGRSSSPNSLATATACEDGPEGEIDARPPTKRQRIAGRMQADSQPEPPATFQQIMLQPVADGTFPGTRPTRPRFIGLMFAPLCEFGLHLYAESHRAPHQDAGSIQQLARVL